MIIEIINLEPKVIFFIEEILNFFEPKKIFFSKGPKKKISED